MYELVAYLCHNLRSKVPLRHADQESPQEPLLSMKRHKSIRFVKNSEIKLLMWLKWNGLIEERLQHYHGSAQGVTDACSS